ncbi:hypothetical protein FACS1894178_7930 [Bacteroidia bacterium]|nr:hypothetical protein FACS1894178_7930 [Bacteroidia bacterium]
MKTDSEKKHLRQALVICILVTAAAILCTFYGCAVINNLRHNNLSEFDELPNINFSLTKNKRCFSTKQRKMFADNQLCLSNAKDIDLCLHFGEKIVFTGAMHPFKTPCIPSERQTFFCKTNKSKPNIRDMSLEKASSIELNYNQLEDIAFQTGEGKKGIIHITEITKNNCRCNILIEK